MSRPKARLMPWPVALAMGGALAAVVTIAAGDESGRPVPWYGFPIMIAGFTLAAQLFADLPGLWEAICYSLDQALTPPAERRRRDLARTERLAAEYDLPWVRDDGTVTTSGLPRPGRRGRCPTRSSPAPLTGCPWCRDDGTVTTPAARELEAEAIADRAEMDADAAYESLYGKPSPVTPIRRTRRSGHGMA